MDLHNVYLFLNIF